MPDHSLMRLGKKPPRRDSRTLQMARYLSPELTPPPSSCDFTNGQTSWGMMLNDQLGDCTIADCGHLVMVWTLVINQEAVILDDVVREYYEKWCGYDPSQTQADGTNPTDNGGVEIDVLNQWRQSDFAGHKITAYGQVNQANPVEVKQALNLFTGLYIGAALPVSAQNQDVWDVVDGDYGEPGSWGGHAIPVVAYDDNTLTCITWGALKKMTWAWWEKYVDEAYAIVSPDYMTEAGLDVAGVDVATLMQDLAVITRPPEPANA